MEQRPLMLQEFIGPLSLCSNTMQDQYKEYQKFTDMITGDGKRRADIEAKLKGEDDDGDPKKKKKERNEENLSQTTIFSNIDSLFKTFKIPFDLQIEYMGFWGFGSNT